MEQNGLLHRFTRHIGLAPTRSSMTADILDEATISRWLVNWLAGRLRLPAAEIDPSQPFSDYGLDSIVAVQASGELETLVGRRLSPALLFEYPSINELTSFLANGLSPDAGDGSETDRLSRLELDVALHDL